MQTMKVKINDVNISYSKIGNGLQTLLLFPGVLGSSRDYAPLTDNLDHEKYTMIIWDPPGYGFSRPPDRDFSPGYLHRDADYAISLMEALNIDRYSVLGWCSGGSTAIIVASKVAGRVDRLVVWNSNVYVTETDVRQAEATQDVRQWPAPRRQPMARLYGETYLSATIIAWVDSCRTALQQNGGNICREALPKITAPALILHGAQDGLISVRHSVYLHENIGGSTLKIYPDGTHNMHFLITKQFISTVDQFLSNDQSNITNNN